MRVHRSMIAIGMALMLGASRGQSTGHSLGWSGVSGLAGGSSAGLGGQVTGVVGQVVAGDSQDTAGALQLRGGYGAVYGVYPFTVTLQAGWNLVSVPLIPLIPGLEQVLPARVAGPLWEATPDGYRPVVRVEPLQGYWVWSAQAASRVMLGVLLTDASREVPSGWSLVGPAGGPPYPGLAVPLASDPAGAVPGLPWGWSAAVGAYQPTVGPLVHGSAYWVYASVPAVLQLGGE